MKCLLIVLFIFTNTILVDSQLVQVSGYILQKGDSSVSIPHAAIENKRTHSGYQSTADGFYTMLLAPGDTIEVSLIGYKTTRISLPAGYTASTYHKNVYLKEDALNLTGYTKYSITWEKFKEAFESIAVEEEKTYITLDNSNMRTIDKPLTGVTLNGPISWLYNKLGKKAKEQNKLEELRQGNDADMEYTRRISDQFVMEATHLQKDKVNDFLQFCHSDVSFYAYASDYDIKAKFISCLPEFKKKYNIVDVVPEINPTPTDSIKASPH